MLSFLKNEQTSIPASSQMENSDQQTEQSVSSCEDYLTVAGHGKRLKQSTILLAGLFVIGGACVWVMIKKTTPASASAAIASSEENVQIESALAQLSGIRSEVTAQMQKVSGRFNQFAQVGQVAVEDLKKNPFKRESAAAAVESSNDSSLATQQWLRNQAHIRAASLDLCSITALPDGACCMINDKVLYKGDQIDGFTVTEIRDNSVSLVRDGVDVELRMD